MQSQDQESHALTASQAPLFVVFYDLQFCFLLEWMIGGGEVILILIDIIGKNEVTGVKILLFRNKPLGY